jgi:hypothetical protein
MTNINTQETDYSVDYNTYKVISHGPKFREPQHINWKHNFKIIMDAVEDYARRWIRHL